MKRFTILDQVRGVLDPRYSKTLRNRDIFENCARGKNGLEIGGPGRILYFSQTKPELVPIMRLLHDEAFYQSISPFGS